MAEIEIKLYRPHAGQIRIQEQARRFGKTELMISVAMPLLAPAIFHGKKVGVFVDNQKDFKESWNGIVARYGMFKDGGLITHKNETEKNMHFLGGGLLEVWSIGNEGKKEEGRGRKYHRVIYEETQKITDSVLKHHWEKVARLLLTDYQGDAYFIGTANGIGNYWHSMAKKGAKNGNCEVNHFGDKDLETVGNHKDWITFRMVTLDNPHINPAEVDEIEKDLDRLSFEQECYSIFVNYDGEAWVYVLKEKPLQQKVFAPSKPINWALDQLYISFDFNKIPMTAVVGKKTVLSQTDIISSRYKYGIHIVKEFKIGSIEKGEASIYDTCQAIREWVMAETGRKIGAWWEGGKVVQRLPCTIPFLITGDASGARSDGKQKVPLDYYEIIQDELQVGKQQIIIPKANPLHAQSYVQTNTIISLNPDFKIYEDKCPALIQDVLRIKSNNSRQIMKGKGEERQADLLDCLRYFLNTFCADAKL
jgi:hypothetical protein